MLANAVIKQFGFVYVLLYFLLYKYMYIYTYIFYYFSVFIVYIHNINVLNIEGESNLYSCGI